MAATHTEWTGRSKWCQVEVTNHTSLTSSTEGAILMTTTCPTPLLSDDHIDLLVTAAADWRLLASPTTAAFAQSSLERHVVVASSTDAGRMLRAENTAAVQWLSDHGRTRLVDRAPAGTYTHHRVDTIDAVEVIKAVHSAQLACRNSPTWAASTACRLLAALVTAATHRLPGYADAPWSWTRPQLRCGPSVGVALPQSSPPSVPGLTWVAPEQVREHWTDAPLVVIRCAASCLVPADLPSRSGVFVLSFDGQEDANQVWEAVSGLNMPTLALLWPSCRPWLMQQLRHPSPEFVEHRNQS